MPAYIIAQINVTDPEKYQEYAKLAGPATAKYGGRFLVRGGAKTELEGRGRVASFIGFAAAWRSSPPVPICGCPPG